MGINVISGQDVNTESSLQMMQLGVYAETPDGRGFRYAKVGVVATVPGKVYQGPAEDTTNQNPSGGLGVAAQAVGDTSVTLSSSVTLAANLLADGYMIVVVTPGLGQIYRVKGNTAVTAAASCVVSLVDPIRVALNTSSKVSFRLHPYNGVVVAPATLTSNVTGVAVNIITAAYFGWIQTHGPVSCLQTGTGTCGTALGVLQGGTIGSLAPAIAGTPIIGHCMGTVITGEYGPVFLTLN